MAAAKEENEEFLRTSELRELQRELSLLQQQNAHLKGRLEDPPLSSPLTKPLTVQDVRTLPTIPLRSCV